MNDKPHLVPVTDPAEIKSVQKGWTELHGLDTIAGAFDDASGIYYAEADDLKRWRARRAAETVTAIPGE